MKVRLSLLRNAPLLLLAGLPMAAADESPPVQIIMDLHMDPMNAIPLQMRPQVYQNWRDAATWYMDASDARGAKLTFLSVGEYMEYTLADPASWPLLKRLAAGGSIGTHSHLEKKYGTHDWRNLPPNAPLQVIIEMWNDHVGAVDAVLTAALGINDPKELRALNNIRGSHLPSDDTQRIELMRQFGFTMHQQGPDEQFFAYFKHHPMNPYRPSGSHFLTHDPNGPVIDSPFGPVLGRNDVHFGIQQDMRLPAMKTRFLLCLFNWLDDVFVAKTGRVWDYGWGAHGSDIVPGQPTRAAVEPMLDWLKQNFVDQTVSGRQALAFSSARTSRDLYLAWEAAHPGSVSFSYPDTKTNWALYPYLLPVARYLVDGQYDSGVSVGSVRLHKVIAAPGIGGPYDLYVAYPSGASPIVADLSSVLGPGPIVAANPHTGLAPPVATNQVAVPVTGVLLLPLSKRLALPNGDVNLDGYLNNFDIDPFVAVLTGQDPDPNHRAAADVNRDGVVDNFDIDPFVKLLTGP